ncbi:MAG TPA: zinc-binding dehydrogenase [Candidatus Scatosoma pullistercoris]|uniref:Zinc-binding dehydrogenase n=1 Tax=Candidatus Scatosoma pullistercoris TaxID=2840934 RepID=A0A9D1SFX7_9FIRM|nr:zinc-binding dehydrogenase [Candidatus Scatosoma pullistercoris]
MKIWQLNSPNHLQREEAPDLVRGKDQVKIKVTKALLSEADVSVFTGLVKVRYPAIPGRFAIGQVTECAPDSFIQKGDRVFLASVTEDECAPDGLRVAGETAPGFYRDFVLAGPDEAYVLPASVSDEAAFLIDAVAMAEHVVDEMNVSVGQHVLVIGGGLYGNVLCQILIYHRAVPILADNNAERLARAKKSGIYYTFPNDETLKGHILEVTGGKLADAAVYLAFSNKSEPSSLFSLVARGAHVAFCAPVGKNLVVNLGNALKNNVTVKGITESREFVSTAINILANKAVNFNEFPYRSFPEEALPDTMLRYAEILRETGSLPEEMDIFKFIF